MILVYFAFEMGRVNLQLVDEFALLRVTHALWYIVSIFDYFVVYCTAGAVHRLTSYVEIAFVSPIHIDWLWRYFFIAVDIHLS